MKTFNATLTIKNLINQSIPTPTSKLLNRCFCETHSTNTAKLLLRHIIVQQHTWFLDCCILSLCGCASLLEDTAGSEWIEPTGVGYE